MIMLRRNNVKKNYVKKNMDMKGEKKSISTNNISTVLSLLRELQNKKEHEKKEVIIGANNGKYKSLLCDINISKNYLKSSWEKIMDETNKYMYMSVNDICTLEINGIIYFKKAQDLYHSEPKMVHTI